MIVALKHSDWQLLRYVLRAEEVGQKPLGRELRLTPSRFTKDGTFLDELVEKGLIAVAAKPSALPAGATRAEKNEPAQFRARYQLTERGRYAAEYGEYDLPYTPAATPVSGIAAEIVATLAGRSFSGRSAQQPEANKARKRGKGR
jgi:hypothetical protein